MGVKAAVEEIDIKKIMARAWDIDHRDVPSDAEFKKYLQWDSLGHVALLVALEAEYKIDINYDTLTELINIQVIIKFIKESSHGG